MGLKSVHHCCSNSFLPPHRLKAIDASMRQSILLPTLACLILIVAHRVRGFSSGAPEESCDSLTVNHTHVGRPSPGGECGPPCLTRQLRWIANSSAESFIYNCNETYQLQLTTTDPDNESLNGYMVAPREDTGTTLDGSVAYVGSWETGTDLNLRCNGRAVTQSNILVLTTTVNMTWKAPMYGFQNVAFWFVIVPSTAFYYLPVKSLTATPNHSQCSCPPGECAMNTTATDIRCVEPSDSLCSSGEVFSEAKCQCEDCSLSIFCMNGGELNPFNCTCVCPAIYSGMLCENCSRVCLNGGSLNEGNCTCACTDGYSGDNCETCSRVCQNEGALNNGTCMCDCADGFSGPDCETCSRMCQNGGTLRNDDTCMCDCADGYSRNNCETCSRVCQNEGTLRNDDTCMCDCADGYSGDNCEIRPAASPIPVVYIVIGCCLGVAVIIVGLIILVSIVLVCIFKDRRAKFDSNDRDKVQLKSLTAQNVDSQCLNPQLSTSEDVTLEQNPVCTVIELDKPTTEPLGKEDMAGETSDDLKYQNPA